MEHKLTIQEYVDKVENTYKAKIFDLDLESENLQKNVNNLSDSFNKEMSDGFRILLVSKGFLNGSPEFSELMGQLRQHYSKYYTVFQRFLEARLGSH
ncbi:hypothetical protein M8845_18975 [Gelidibacter japonicus]|uniref:hypothetical protein n=1 Tax=Gelidibacter japonicus TaxID=1962232 RepID=UPI0020229482|nr:hypothetical protein [Gelidibacter japonicus]MCL8009512.1 hypothetical protein [Gelidibacter japonicus]